MTVQEIAEQSLKSLLASLGFSADIEITETDGIVCLNISSPDSQYIIGGDGDRLDDLQYLVNRMIQRKMEDAPRVKVDCDHYRERNEARLLEKARSLAERVQESGKPMKMPPLNAYHRRLVHNALQSMEGIVTESEDGDSRYKRITIRKDFSGHCIFGAGVSGTCGNGCPFRLLFCGSLPSIPCSGCVRFRGTRFSGSPLVESSPAGHGRTPRAG